MEEGIRKVGYRLVRNAMSTTADKAPFLGVAIPVGSSAYGEILKRMLKNGTFMTNATVRYLLNAFYEYAAERIAEDVVRINMGSFAIYPMIGGSFDSEDDEFRAPRNTLYVGATLSRELRDTVSGIVPKRLGDDSAKDSVKISSIMDLASETYRLIVGVDEFRIAGIDLTVPDGEDESLSLVAEDGETKVADITVVSTEEGQRIICVLASAVPAGMYYVRLVSHGLDPTAPLSTVLYSVKVKAASTPSNPPNITSGHSESHADDGKCYADGSGFVLEGDNLEGAIVTIAGSANEGETWSYEETVPADKVNFDADMLTIDGDWLDVWYNHLDLGELVKFTVETTSGEDSIQRVLAN